MADEEWFTGWPVSANQFDINTKHGPGMSIIAGGPIYDENLPLLKKLGSSSLHLAFLS